MDDADPAIVTALTPLREGWIVSDDYFEPVT
jgi:hypothetical protein